MNIDFPRIYSLSTLGIIYHFNTDYRFHPFRTDFSGEGGSGKTMITDMIQLILVGPSAYSSSTEGTLGRPADGMVYQSKKRTYAAGYLILNVEVSPGKYLAIGAFIEKSSKIVKMFIAQAGFDWEDKLEYLDKPVYYKQFLVNGQIVPIEMLDDDLEDINVKVFSTKHYHSLLYQHEILTLDLSESRKKLDSYASIFRSFSRGKGLKTDPSSLKNFLFGDDDRQLLAKYNNEVKSISDGYQEQSRYKSEIELIDKKQGFIKDLVLLEKAFIQSKADYFTERVLFWHQLKGKQDLDFEQCELNYDRVVLEKQYLDIRYAEFELEEMKNHVLSYRESQQFLSGITERLEKWEEAKENQMQLIATFADKVKQIERIRALLDENDGELSDVKLRFAREAKYKDEQLLLTNFVKHLDKNRSRGSFEASRWSTDYALEKLNYAFEAKADNDRLLELKALSEFADLGNPDSLAAWAMDYFDRPLSLEEESVLLHFQSLKRTEPKDVKADDRYLPEPYVLFETLDIHETAGKKGFWLALDGVYEFIDYATKQYLNIGPEKKLEVIAQLKQLSKGLTAEIKELEAKILEREGLKGVLDSFFNTEGAVVLLASGADYDRAVDEKYLMENSDIEALLALYETQDKIFEQQKAAKLAHEQLIKDELRVDPENHKGRIKASEAHFELYNVPVEGLDKRLADMGGSLGNLRNDLHSLQLSNGLSDDALTGLKETLLKEVKNLNTLNNLRLKHVTEFNKTEQTYSISKGKSAEAERKLRDGVNEYKYNFREDFDFDLHTRVVLFDPDDGDRGLKSKYDHDRVKFEQKYNLIVDEAQDAVQLKDSFHVGQLAHRLLPTVFTTPQALEEQEVELLLSEKLTSLYEAIRQIGTHKIEILKRVFSEVHKAFREHVAKVAQIDAYFKKPNKVITGGNKASLALFYPKDYPAKWMSVFARMLDDQTPYTLFEKISKEIDINEMMKQAFVDEGGTKNANIDDLLNPKSYFDLEFTLVLESGELNSGSNSQTYSGNALLGLARLSLIEDPDRKGIRIMPIDEAQGLGSNYEMLRKIAIAEHYQILSMSIDTAGEIRVGEQYIYMLSENKLQDEYNYVPAMGIFSEGVITRDLDEFIYGDQGEG
jgi:exonuclease SbcC